MPRALGTTELITANVDRASSSKNPSGSGMRRQRANPRAVSARFCERAIAREARATRKPAQPPDHKSESAKREKRAKRTTKRCGERDTQKKTAFEA